MKNNFKNCLSKVGCLPIIRLPPLASPSGRQQRQQKFFAEGVDGQEKRCKMSGSLGTKCSEAETETIRK
jgi:hypothetical protein